MIESHLLKNSLVENFIFYTVVTSKRYFENFLVQNVVLSFLRLFVIFNVFLILRLVQGRRKGRREIYWQIKV